MGIHSVLASLLWFYNGVQEVYTLREAVQRFKRGDWKGILEAHKHVFQVIKV